jgi:Zn ribbon nucleic-acid-binding protein
MLKSATMTELAEARARRGFCPNCQAQSLRHIGSDGGIVFRKCAECGTVAVLGA